MNLFFYVTNLIHIFNHVKKISVKTRGSHECKFCIKYNCVLYVYVSTLSGILLYAV